MSDQPADPNDADTGEPIAELRNLEQPISAQFVSRLRRRIYRRLFTSQVVSLVWYVPAVVLAEFLTIIFQSIVSDRRGGRSEG